MSSRKPMARVLLLLFTAACGAAFLVQGLLLAGRQQQALALAWEQEVESVYAISGAIIADHPELEGELAELLRGEHAPNRELGKLTLSKYGYRLDRPVAETGRYRDIQRTIRVRQWLFAATGALLCLLIWLHQSRRERAQCHRIAAVLDSYLSGDFGFAQYSLSHKRHTGSWNRLEEDLRRLGGQIRLQQTRLTEEKESTRMLVTDISHQLKTPIAALKTCFSLYLEAEEGAERQEFQDRCLLQMDKLEVLTAALMNISRLESAMITLRPEPVDLKELLMLAVNGVFDKAADKDIGLELLPFAPVTVKVDRRWTAEAFLNLLDNAVKYSPPDTSIRIAVQVRHSFVRVEIADEGIGIPKEEQNRVFQRFFRGNHDLVRSTEGAGVGLYLTRAILEDQGGTVHVRSAAGQGATFVAQLFREL